MVKLMQDLSDAKLAADEQTSAQTMWMQEKNELLEAAVALEANHQAAITWLEGQLKNHQSSLAWTQTQLQNHQASLAWAEGELKRQQANLALLEGQLKESQNALLQAQSQINFDALSLAQLQQALAAAEQEISSLKNSRSWRYTRFLRRTS
jgi:chromosome segregation ATPase